MLDLWWSNCMIVWSVESGLINQVTWSAIREFIREKNHLLVTFVQKLLLWSLIWKTTEKYILSELCLRYREQYIRFPSHSAKPLWQIFISWKHNVVCIFYAFFTVSKKERKWKRQQRRQSCLVIHRQTGNHIITSEICHCSRYLFKILQKKKVIVPAKIVSH